jgi:hypothetical protein
MKLLRLNTLDCVLLPQLKIVKKAIVFLMMLSCPLYSQNASMEDVKKEANRLFEAEDYTKAYKLYSQLVSNYPKDPGYNFRLGVCMIYGEPDKKKCLPYLQFASKNKNDDTKDVHFYLGKAYHINYLFDEAIKNYNEFRQTAPASRQKKLQVDREIAACAFGKKLLSHLTDLVIQSKKQLNEADYFRSYDLKDMGGKLLVKPDEFRSSADKKKKEKSIVFLPKTGNRVYYSSYGENADQGKDIYYSVKMADGTYSKPEKVAGINTEFDEDYPFLHPNGQTLYFASKGHNSMGGYDIFKSTYIEASNSWSPPVNLEFPINSPDDDYLFVTDSLEKTAYFSTGRQSPPGKIDVLRINTERKPIDVLAIKGNVEKETPGQSLRSKISVAESGSKKPVGIYYAEENGDYDLELPNGARLMFTVETPGQKTQSQEIALPLATESRPFKQTISYVAGILKIINDFDPASSDDNYLQYLKVIEKKARLEVNEGENKLDVAAATAEEARKKQNTAAPQLAETPGDTGTVAKKDPKQGMDNRQLAGIAKQDAKESREEATQLKQDSNDALEVGNQQKEAADKKLLAADEALKNAEGLADENEKKTVIEKASQLRTEAENEAAVANKILAFARSLDADAAAKQKEADLNEQYASELEKAIASKNNNQASLAKLDELQKQISESGSQKNESENLMNSIKTDIAEKEKQVAGLEQTNATVKLNLDEVKMEIASKEEELARAKKKNKEAITTELNDLKAEQSEKEKQIAINDTEIKKLNEELSSLKNELELATKIKTETIAAPPVAANTNTAGSPVSAKSPAVTTTITSNSVAANTKEKPAAAKKTDKPVKTTPAKNTATANKPDYAPVSASTGSEAITKLDDLGTRLSVNDNEIFEFNGYQNPQAQSLKVEADASINDAATQLKKLKDAIALSKTEIQNAPSSSAGAATSRQLTKEADELAVKAQALRSEAATKPEAEKEKLITEARDLEVKADEKYIQAAEVTSSDNKSVFDANLENIKSLVTENKSTEAEVAEAKRLSEEAEIAFKQAVSIREEARALNNAGAKLGSLSNAEEIESGAIQKQQQAVDLLKKSNPGFVLKTPVTSTTQGVAAESAADLAQKLQAVNDGINELANIRINSYQKLYDANASEIEEIMASVNASRELVDKTPSFKSELTSGSGKIENAKGLKQSSETAANTNDKLNSLTAAIKKQTEGLKQLSKLNVSVTKAAAARQEALAKQNKAAETKTTTPLPDQPAVSDPIAAETPTTASAREAAPQNELPMAAGVKTIELSTLAPGDSTAGQLISYFDTTSLKLKNPAASSTVNKSLAELKASEAEIKTLEDKIKNYQPPVAATPVSPIELITKADELLVEAEKINTKASGARNEAANKTGSEQDSLLTKAKELELQSQDKKLEAAALYQEANASDYATNNNAISELLTRLKNDNPALSTELEPKSADLLTLNEQTKKLREEANTLSPAAKLGAISNVEEKEAELIQKQNQLINELKKQYPDYVVKPLNAEQETLEDLSQKKTLARERQYTQLTGLTNAFSLEYETSKNQVPAKLDASQQAVKQNADYLNAESKRLLVASAQEKNESEKLKLLTLSAKAGNAAVEQLSRVIPEKPALAKTNKTPDKTANKTKATSDTSELDKIGKAIAGTNANSNAKIPAAKTPTPAAATAAAKTAPKAKGVVKIEGLEIIKGNAYNNSKPIPVDAKIEDGLVFRVQIGAFKTRLPNDAFRGLSPLNGETAGNGYIRYTAGNFDKVENANAVKNDLRRLGYNDAFVVVYYNGKRISLGEALSIMNEQGKTVDPNAPQTAGITTEANVPKAAAPVQGTVIAAQENVVVTRELEQINGLLYTIQIGVYNKQITRKQILSLKPIFTERLNNGLFRYTAGIYSNADRLITDKRKVVDFGVKDAFVSAYLNGKRIPFSEGKKLQAEDSTVKMEAETPIIFPEAGTTETVAPAETAEPQVVAATTTVQPFKNSVSNYPTPTGDNGVKLNEEGITFKVQIGAYSKQVPEDVAARFSAITTWPVENKQVSGLFVYNIGNFSEARFAKALKEEALKLGISDAFVVVYKNGVKLYGAEASEVLSR